MRVKIVVTKTLDKQIYKAFKKELRRVYALFDTLKEQPQKGKLVAIVGNNVLKEIKYKSHRFYYILKQDQVILVLKKELEELLIIFLAMSKKHDQQKTIDEIKKVLEGLR